MMFGKKSASVEAGTAQMLVTTTMTLPWAYYPLGVVMKEGQHFFRAGLNGLVKELQYEAEKLGAKAVIGVSVGMNMSGGSSTSRVWAIGTAVTWKDPTPPVG